MICSAFTQPEQTFQLVRQEGITNDLAQEILLEAYRRAGLKVEVRIVPAGRALEEASSGRVDGDVARISGTENRYPTLVLVPEVLLTVSGSLFTLKPIPPLASIKDMDSYRLGFRRGLQFAENAAQNTIAFRTTSEDQAFLMMKEGRIDGVIAGNLDGIYTAARLNIHPVYATPLPIESIKLFHYLHISRKDLVPKIAAALKEMASTGVTEKITRSFMEKSAAESM